MISKMTQRLIRFADHPQANSILNLVAFLESWIFPLPPDILLVPMVTQHPQKAWAFALQCSMASVLGGIVGYIIGYYFYNTLGALILDHYGLQENFHRWKADFNTWGVWIILLKGLVPIPYKVVTVFSGLTHFNFLSFLGASIVVRSARFFILSGLCYRYGPHIRPLLNRYMGWIFAVTIVIIIGGYAFTKWF